MFGAGRFGFFCLALATQARGLATRTVGQNDSAANSGPHGGSRRLNEREFHCLSNLPWQSEHQLQSLPGSYCFSYLQALRFLIFCLYALFFPPHVVISILPTYFGNRPNTPHGDFSALTLCDSNAQGGKYLRSWRWPLRRCSYQPASSAPHLRTASREIVATLALLGSPEPLSMLQAFLIRTLAGGVLVMKEKERSA